MLQHIPLVTLLGPNMRIVIILPTLLGIAVLLGVCRRGGGQDLPSKQNAALNYEKLISQLVSPNKESITVNGGRSSATFPIGYDAEAQKRIAEVRQVLFDNIEDSLPSLVGALDDDRYCMTINWIGGDYFYNYSVGKICKDIIASHLEVYRVAISFEHEGHWNRYNYPISKKWWEERKGRRLSALQIDAIDWAIERRKAEPVEFVREGRENEVAELVKLRETIAKSGKPAASRKMLRMVTRDSTN
jgi:hypothetical protein